MQIGILMLAISWQGEASRLIQAIISTQGTHDYLVRNCLAAISVLSINRGDLLPLSGDYH